MASQRVLSWPVSITMEATSCDETLAPPRGDLKIALRQRLHVWASVKVQIVSTVSTAPD